MSAPQTSQPANDLVAPGYTAYAQLVRMLLPSSGSLAIYAVDGNLLWCSDGFERPDFRELVDTFRAGDAGVEPNFGHIRQTGSGVRALVAKLCDEDGQPLGHVLIELGEAQSGTGNAMAASLTRPLLACLAMQLAQERLLAQPPGVRADDRRLRRLLNVCSVDVSTHSALHDMLRRCVDQLRCMSAIFCIPDQDLTEIAYCDDLADPDIRSQFDATRKHLIAWVQLNNRPMVVNGIDNARTPFKILSCPVIGRSGQSNGLLALFRSAQSPNFELDDVVLIEILSRQAMSVAAQRYDPLTGLLNQSGFEHRLDQHLGGASAGSGALLYVDVPDLSAINAAFGYGTGDEVIRGVAQMLRASLATGERACRLSGHRFVVFCPDSDQQAAAARGAKLAESARQLEYVDADTRIPVQLRFAAAASPGGESCGRHWIAAAELACRET